MTLQIVVPAGMFGGSSGEDRLTHFLRALAHKHRREDEWAEKYGTQHDDGTWSMHPFCWCEEKECQWCSDDAPNFLYKPTGFRITWYKYIGRGMEIEGQPDDGMWALVDASDLTRLEEYQKEQAAGVAAMFSSENLKREMDFIRHYSVGVDLFKMDTYDDEGKHE